MKDKKKRLMKISRFFCYYLENIFTSHKIKYNPTPKPASKTARTKAIRICDVCHPNLLLNHSETPKIILFFIYNLILFTYQYFRNHQNLFRFYLKRLPHSKQHARA